MWWSLLVACVVYLPMLLYFWPQTEFTGRGWCYVLASGILHALYFWFLTGAYERGDLSLVYPLSRGTGPLLVPLLAVALINEQLSLLGTLGIAAVVFGIYTIHLRSFSKMSFWEPFAAPGKGGSLWALLTGGTIAAYSLVDKVGVGIIYPPVYIYLVSLITWMLLSTYVLSRERPWVVVIWKINSWSVLGVGLLVVLTYMMVLFAMLISKISYVVAVREVSIVFSAAYGILWLKEKNPSQKLVGSFFIFLGVVAIGLSR